MDILFQTFDVWPIWLALPWYFQWAIIGLAGIAGLRIIWIMLSDLTLTIALMMFAFGLGFFLVEGGYLVQSA